MFTLKTLLIGAVATTLLQHLPYLASAHSTEPNTEGVTAPVEFLWPSQRPWYASYGDASPCGTNASVGNRSDFPLDAGAVSLSIAEDAYSIIFRIAYMNDPLTQSDFTTQIVHTVSEIEAGHQCYYTPDTPDDIASGTNATIQLQYVSVYDNGGNETFYACADVTLVDDALFTTKISCFNVTVTGASPDGVVSSSASSAAAAASSSSSENTQKNSDLSAGVKAGIAVGSIAGAAVLVGVAAFALLRKRRVARERDSEAARLAGMRKLEDNASFTSAESRARS